MRTLFRLLTSLLLIFQSILFLLEANLLWLAVDGDTRYVWVAFALLGIVFVFITWRQTFYYVFGNDTRWIVLVIPLLTFMELLAINPLNDISFYNDPFQSQLIGFELVYGIIFLILWGKYNPNRARKVA